jgi:hypothetical protein
MRKLISALSVAGVLHWGTAVIAAEPVPVVSTPAPVAKGVDKSAPDYVRCRTFNEIGSLVRKIKACRTNAEWKKINDAGNQYARIIVQSGIPGASCTENC